jgi:hypothetical protein
MVKLRITPQAVICGGILAAIRLKFLRLAENDVIFIAICITLRIADEEKR